MQTTHFNSWKSQRVVGAILLAMGVCAGSGIAAILCSDMVNARHSPVSGLVGVCLLVVAVLAAATGFTMVADWHDPFDDDQSMPEVRTFPEDDVQQE